MNIIDKKAAINSGMLSVSRLRKLADDPSPFVKNLLVCKCHKVHEDIFYKLSFDEEPCVKYSVISRCRKKHRCILERLANDHDKFIRELAINRCKKIGVKLKC